MSEIVMNEGRDAVLQLGQLIGDICRHQVTPRRQHLTEFDENRPQGFQCQTQALGPRRLQPAPELQRIGQSHQAAGRLMFEHHLIESETAGASGNLEQAEEAHREMPGMKKGLQEKR